MRAEKSTAELRFQMNRKSMITASHEIRRKEGYTVNLALSDGVSEVISMKLFAASEAQAKALAESFKKNAENIYNNVIRLILDM
jgi:S-adenosylhomocysteine hydrolase